VGAAQRKKKLGINISIKGPSMRSSWAGIFTQIRSVWIGELETGTKTSRPRKIFFKFLISCV
jgi:hypothetical protein